MKNKILNIFIGASFLWTTISGVYLVAIPQDIKDTLPINWLTALLSGGATGLLGSVAVYFKAFFTKEKGEREKDINNLAQTITKITTLYKELVVIYNVLNDKVEGLLVEQNKDNINVKDLLNKLDNLLMLTRIDLETKLTNPLIDKEAFEIIRGALNEQEKDNL